MVNYVVDARCIHEVYMDVDNDSVAELMITGTQSLNLGLQKAQNP